MIPVDYIGGGEGKKNYYVIIDQTLLFLGHCLKFGSSLNLKVAHFFSLQKLWSYLAPLTLNNDFCEGFHCCYYTNEVNICYVQNVFAKYQFDYQPLVENVS